MDRLHAVINFFHKDDRFNRTTFGVDRLRGGLAMIRWRLTDAIWVSILVVMYPLVYRIQPFQRQFYIGDLLISHPFAEHERVPGAALFFYAGWFPFASIVVLALLVTKPANKVYVAYVSALGHLLSVFSASIITDVVKNSFGRHRPDFLARCVPKADAPTDILVYAKDVCTTDNIARLMDGFRTTPLGHSSISFAGLLYFSFWLAGQLTITRPQAGAWRWVVSFLPAFGAALIALGRTEDYRHHFIDVFVGLCLGAVIALWLYFRLFPGLGQAGCYEPRLLEVNSESEYESVGV